MSAFGLFRRILLLPQVMTFGSHLQHRMGLATHARLIHQSSDTSNPPDAAVLERKVDKKKALLALFSQYDIPASAVQKGFHLYDRLVYKSVENTEKKLKFLVSLGMNAYQLEMMVSKGPSYFGLSMDKSIIPKIRLFKDFGLTDYMICEMLTRSPVILGLSSERSLHVRMLYVQGIVGPEKFVGLVTSHPNLVVINAQRWAEYLDIMKDLGISEPENISRLVTLCPQSLGLNFEKNLVPKIKAILVYLMGKGLTQSEAVDEVKKWLVKYPSLLGLSLERRIAPRLDSLSRLPNPPAFSARLLRAKDEEFAVFIKACEAAKTLQNTDGERELLALLDYPKNP